MAAHTKQDLVTAAMRRLSAIDQNAQPSAPEMAQFSSVYDDKLAELTALDLVYWSNSGSAIAEIPAAAFQALVRIMAEEIAPALGEQIPTEQDEDGTPLSIGNKGLRMLRRQMSKYSSDLSIPIHYF